ncbi:MAG: serine/threonine protein kinase, partial [Dehalococcoidia bacterium]|nr:serine/threonine protein kinase [Dehalococcoidia bacterium]
MQVGEAVLLDGRYRLERVLGSGGTSEVWLARDVVANVPVAIKRVLPGAGGEARDALRREAQIGRRLHHVNIVQVLESGEARGLPYLVTEYVEGPSLRELLGWRGGLPEADVVDIGRAVASALAHAHRRGILHNDLKPENILLGPTGPKVADFGAASSLTQTVGPQRAQELMGTIAYLAPEVLQGEEPSIRSDLYALGLTLYEAAAGRLPFPGATPAAIAGQRLAQPPPPVRVLVPSASYELEATLARALQLNPSARFASAAELAAWLAAAPMVGHATVVIRRRTPGPPVAAVRTGGGSRRGRIVAGSGVVGLLFAGGALALGLWSGDKGVDDPGRD